MAATIIYYGSLTDDKEKLRAVSWPVLGIFGENDTSIPVASVESFKQALNTLGVVNEIYVYPQVGHAFANPSGARYAAKETKDAWEKTLRFLEKHVKEKKNPQLVDAYTCNTDSDCVVKDVHNCCGYYPACVNKNYIPDIEAVKRECEKKSMASICGFPEISECKCVASSCKSG